MRVAIFLAGSLGELAQAICHTEIGGDVSTAAMEKLVTITMPHLHQLKQLCQWTATPTDDRANIDLAERLVNMH